MSWDFENKLTSADTDEDGEADVTYQWDALLRRVARTADGETTVFAPSGQQTVADYRLGAAPATAKHTYVFGSYIDEPIMRGGEGGLRFFHRNQQYSVVALTDGGGGVVERYAYDAYGDPSFFDGNGNARTTSAGSNRYTYTGREWDEALGLYHYRARMYDSLSGRFCSRDPIGYMDGLNLYASQFAVSSTDPLGLHRVPVIVHPLGAPRRQPWSKGKCSPGEYACTKANVSITCDACKKCKCKGYYVPNCRISATFTVTIDVDLLRSNPPEAPDDPSYREPDWTYGHEQRHVRNAVQKLRQLGRSLQRSIHAQQCVPNQAPDDPLGDQLAALQCEQRRLLLGTGKLNDFLDWWREETDHQHGEPEDGEPYPPIGPMPDPSNAQ